MSSVAEQLERQIRAIEQLRKLPHDNPEIYKWRDEVHNILRKQFGPISSQIRQFDSIVFSPTTFGLGMPESYFVLKYQKGLDTAEVFLKALVEQLTPASASPVSPIENPAQPMQQSLPVKACPYGHKAIELLGVYTITAEDAAKNPALADTVDVKKDPKTARGYRCINCNLVFYVLST